MPRRLVLECGEVGFRVVQALQDDDMLVIDSDPDRVEALREYGLAVEDGDPSQPSVVRSYAAGVDSVLVLGDSGVRNQAVASAARTAVPGAVVIAYAGGGSSAEVVDGLTRVADRVIRPEVLVADHITGTTVGEGARKARELMRVLRSLEGSLGVFMHDNPDPDAIGSAVALRALAESVGLRAEVCYYGEITHQENRALVNLLDLPLVRLDADDDLSYDHFALVDHARPGVNDQLPEGTPIDIVIDHHPPRGPVSATFTDLRVDAGATSTVLADYLHRYGRAVSRRVATALLYGIRVDTSDFSRNVGPVDLEAAVFLSDKADRRVLDRIESPSVTGETLETIGRAITNRVRQGSVLASCVGVVHDRDALAQAAERLLTIEGITTTFVYGVSDGMVYVSARSTGGEVDIGEALGEGFGQIGSAGGHTDMAGAQIPIGMLGVVENGGSELAVVAEVVTNRFFEVIGLPAVETVPVDELGVSEAVGG